MGRNPGQPDRDAVPEQERHFYDQVVDRLAAMGAPAGQGGPYFGALLQSPPLAAAISNLGSLVRTGQQRGSYSHAEREFVDMVLSKDLSYNGVLPVHISDALAVGVRLEAIEGILGEKEEVLTDDERQLLQFIRQVAGGVVDDDTYRAMEKRLGTRGVVEYTIFVAFLQFTLRLMQAFDVPEPTDAEIQQLLREFREGKRKPESADARIR